MGERRLTDGEHHGPGRQRAVRQCQLEALVGRLELKDLARVHSETGALLEPGHVVQVQR